MLQNPSNIEAGETITDMVIRNIAKLRGRRNQFPLVSDGKPHIYPQTPPVMEIKTGVRNATTYKGNVGSGMVMLTQSAQIIARIRTATETSTLGTRNHKPLRMVRATKGKYL